MFLIFLLAAFGAVLPTVVYVSIAWWLDRYEKEPWWLLALTFFWGAVPAIILAAVSEWIVMLPVVMIRSGGDLEALANQSGEEMTTVMAITASVVAPLVEETLKAVPLLFIFFMFRREFDGLMDGLLYGALVGFGFAMTENFFYIFGTGASSGISAEALVFFLRTIVFGMMHALWSSMFGVGLAIARYARPRTWGRLAPCGGLMLGMLLHCIHNSSAVTASQGGVWAAVGVSVMLGSYGLGCLVWLALVFIAGRREATWIREELVEEVATGLLTADQARACARYRSRVTTRWGAFRERGFGHASQLGRLYSLGADLAFKKRQLVLDPTETKRAEETVRLREEIRVVQAALAGEAPGTPVWID